MLWDQCSARVGTVVRGDKPFLNFLVHALCHTHTHTHHHHEGKNQRLKEAKEEAAKEIEEYRKQRESEFQEEQKKSFGSKDDFEQKMKGETDQKLSTINVEVKEHKEEVIQRLLQMVYDIKPELHINYREGKGQQAS